MKQINAEIACDKNTASSESSGLINQLRQTDIGAVPIALFITICAIVAISAYAKLLPKNMIWRPGGDNDAGPLRWRSWVSIPVLRAISAGWPFCV